MTEKKINPLRRETGSENRKSDEEIFLPVKDSGREVSILDILNAIKRENTEKYRLKNISRRGKHSGAENLNKGELKNIGFSDIDLTATIRTHMLKKKRYRNRRKTAILFCVDGSRSQGAKERLGFAKGAVMAILKNAYTERNRVGMILFGDRKAETVLPYTKSVDFAAEKIKDIKAKGNTPLSMAMRLSVTTVEQDRKRNHDDLHVVILLTDGKSNFDVEEGRPLSLTLDAADEFKRRDISILVVDTENTVFGMGLAKKIAERAGGKYVKI